MAAAYLYTSRILRTNNKILHSAPPCCISLTSSFSCQLYCTPPVIVLTSQSLAIAPSVAGCHRMHASWTIVYASFALPVAVHCFRIIAPASCWLLHLHHHHHLSCLLLLLHHDVCLSVASHCIYIISASCSYCSCTIILPVAGHYIITQPVAAHIIIIPAFH